MTRFNYLNIPQHWQQYWDKYPQGYTILEALMQWVQQVDKMVDNQNGLNQKVEQFRKELDDFLAGFDADLKQTVIEVFNIWLADGTIEDLINDVLLERKVDKTYIEGRPVNALELGFKADGVTDNKALFAAHFKQGTPVNIFFPPGKYLTTETINVPGGSNIELVGDVTFIGDNFTSGYLMEVNKEADEANTHTVLNNLSTASELTKGSKKLRISQVLQPGDIVAIKDPANGSWYSSRDYYQKGEFLEVSHQIGETVYFKESLKDTYKTTDTLALMKFSTVNISGRLKVHQKTNKFDVDGVRLNLLKNNHYDIEAQVDSGNAALSLTRCFGITLDGVGHQKNFLAGSLGYGLVIANSQNINYTGQFSGARHGVTHGGAPGVGNVVNRNIRGQGTISSNNLGNSFAFDTHTNCEDIYFEGTINGSASLSGSNLTLKGEMYVDTQRAVYLNGLISLNVDLSGMKIYMPDPSLFTQIDTTGVIDCTTLAQPETRPGNMNFSNMVIHNQPSRYVFQLNGVEGKDNSVLSKTKFDFSNLNLTGVDVSNNSVRMFIPVGLQMGSINLLNVDTEKISIRLAAFKQALTNSYPLFTEITVDASDQYPNRIVRIIEYAAAGIPSIKTTNPTMAMNSRPSAIGAVGINVNAYPVATRVTLTITKADNSNFAIGDKITVWGNIQ